MSMLSLYTPLLELLVTKINNTLFVISAGPSLWVCCLSWEIIFELPPTHSTHYASTRDSCMILCTVEPLLVTVRYNQKDIISRSSFVWFLLLCVAGTLDSVSSREVSLQRVHVLYRCLHRWRDSANWALETKLELLQVQLHPTFLGTLERWEITNDNL